MSEKHVLHRFWFKFDGDHCSRLGYGVTAWTQDDAVNILRSQIFERQTLPEYSVEEDVNIAALDAKHIRLNMGNPAARGIWFPCGFAAS